jgi:hypothetical protein
MVWYVCWILSSLAMVALLVAAELVILDWAYANTPKCASSLYFGV